MEIYVFVNGAKKSLTQLAAESGVSYDTLLARYKAGVPGDQLVPKTGAGGTNGKDGKDGEDGATFLPSVDADGNISWTNNKGLPNPDSVNIKGPAGPAGEGGSWVKLWTNASPTSDFAAQTIALDLSPYDFVTIECNYNPSTNVYGTSLCPVNGRKAGLLVPAASTNIYVAFREAVVSTTGITFGSGCRQSLAASGFTSDDGNCLPLVIYGIKGVS